MLTRTTVVLTSIRRLALALPCIGAMSMALVGCGSSLKSEQTLEIAPTVGPLALDIQNFRGGVEIRTDPKLDSVQIFSEVHVDDSTEIPAKERLEAVEVSAAIEEDGPRATLRVRTMSHRADVEDHRVYLTIYTPKCDGLRVVNEGGNVIAVNTRGAMQITNRTGAVEVRTSRPMVDAVTITTTDGNIYYQVPPGSTGKFDLQTLKGITTFVDRVGQSSNSASSHQESYSGSLNDGANDIIARTNNGDVRVWIIEDPVALTRIYKFSRPDPRNSLYLKGQRRYTRNLPDDHAEVTGPSPRASHAFEY